MQAKADYSTMEKENSLFHNALGVDPNVFFEIHCVLESRPWRSKIMLNCAVAPDKTEFPAFASCAARGEERG